MNGNAPITRAEWSAHAAAVREDLIQLRADFRADLHAEVRPIIAHLEALNGRTRANEIGIAVLQTKIAVVGAVFGFAAGSVGAVVGSLLHEWIVK